MSTRATLLKIAVAATDDLPQDTAVLHLRAEAQLSANELIRLEALNSDLLAALKALLPVAELFEQQGRQGSGGGRGYVVFNKAREAIKSAEKQSAGEQS